MNEWVLAVIYRDVTGFYRKKILRIEKYFLKKEIPAFFLFSFEHANTNDMSEISKQG